ncbi:hypothetical protein PAHAL_8G101500 [Panicum hallii]|uniref:Uncharacterized protein n=1 Tax=Panicum hallii TaxID=206008 RepID=A0A2T8I8C6_9POAL|nr:hypothetical protein PAHAL_8G101500 [Panicum hallii]
MPAFNTLSLSLPPSLAEQSPAPHSRPPLQRSRWSGDPSRPFSCNSSKSAHPSAVDFVPLQSPLKIGVYLFSGKDFSDSVNPPQSPITTACVGSLLAQPHTRLPARSQRTRWAQRVRPPAFRSLQCMNEISPLGNTGVEDEEERCCTEARASTVCSCMIGDGGLKHGFYWGLKQFWSNKASIIWGTMSGSSLASLLALLIRRRNAEMLNRLQLS